MPEGSDLSILAIQNPDEPEHEYILASEHAALIQEAEVRGMNNGMLTAIEVVADERNKRNPGPLFEVLNKAIGKIEDARFAALRAAKDAP